MTEPSIKLIEKEDYKDEESSSQKAIFDMNIFEQIKKQESPLKVEKILEIPIVKNWFRKQKEEYYVISQREHTVDCKYAKGKAMIPILNKKELNKEIQAVKSKEPITHVHLGGIEISITACFREGIDTPIEIYLADDRIKYPIEKSVISAIKGNLIYQKFKFIVNPNYSVAIRDKNIDKSLVLYWKMTGIELAQGSKIFTARCRNLYILTTKHTIKAVSKINKIKIENPFDNIVTAIDNSDYSYQEIDMETDLEIVQERIGSSSKRLIDIPTTSSRLSTSRRSTSRRIEQEITMEIQPHQYYITGMLGQRKYLILINTGEQENYITKELVPEDEIEIQGKECIELPRELRQITEITNQELIIGGIPIKIQFTVMELNTNITLGLSWLEQVKPYNIEDRQLIIHYQGKKVTISRTIM